MSSRSQTWASGLALPGTLPTGQPTPRTPSQPEFIMMDTHVPLAAPALEVPVLNTTPLPAYGPDRLDYGMTIGLERTPGGRLWACWVAGGDSQKGYFVLASSEDEGLTWSAPRLVLDPHHPALPWQRRTLVGGLWLDPRGRLWLFLDQAMTFFDGRAGTWYTRCDNPDSADPQWTQPVRIWHGCNLNKPIVASNGEWLLPVSLWSRSKITPRVLVDGLPEEARPENPFTNCFQELDEVRMSNVLVSTDEGETWTRRGGVAFPEPDFDEANLVERRDGSLWMTCRTGGNLGIYQSVSRDGGATWTEPEFYLAHPSTRHFMRRLPSGRLLLVKHGRPVDTRPPTRSHLTAYLSEDDGQTWQGGLVLDERETVSYPDGTIGPDGKIYLSYDYNRNTAGNILLAIFTEADILAGSFQSPGSAARRLIFAPHPAAVALRHQREKVG